MLKSIWGRTLALVGFVFSSCRPRRLDQPVIRPRKTRGWLRPSNGRRADFSRAHKGGAHTDGLRFQNVNRATIWPDLGCAPAPPTQPTYPKPWDNRFAAPPKEFARTVCVAGLVAPRNPAPSVGVE